MMFQTSLLGCLLALFSRGTEAELVVVGGGLSETNAEIFDRIVDLAGGDGVAKIGCICTASADPADSGVYYEDLFISYGAASATYIPVTETSNNADDPEIVALLQAQTGFFFGGGDQERIFNAWIRPDGTDTLGLQAIKEIMAAGGVVGGTSAGAACMGEGPMLNGGQSWNGLRNGAHATPYDPNFDDELIYIENGALGFLAGYVVDSHFSQRGREGRLIELLLDTNLALGIAVDEDTAVQISPTGDCEVLGTDGGVMVVDLREAYRTPAVSTKVSGVRLSFFTEDDKFNIYSDTTNYASWKENLDGAEYYNNAVSSDNIFSSYKKPLRQYSVFRETAHRLWDSKDKSVTSYSYEDTPRFSVLMKKSDGLGFGGYSPVDDTFRVSYYRMEVDIDFALTT